MTLGDIIKNYRNENSVTMEYVASLCGITKGYVAMLEKNLNSKTGRPVKPTIETILKVCAGLKLDVDEVFKALDDDYVITLSSKSIDSSDLTDSEKQLIINYRVLNQEGKEKIADYLDDLVASGRYA